MRYVLNAVLAVALVVAVSGCSKFSNSQEAAAYLEGQFTKYGTYTRGNCSYSLTSFGLEGGKVRYSITRKCGDSDPPAHSIFNYNVALADLEPDAPNGKIDPDGEPMFFAYCKRDLHCVDIIEKYENDPRGIKGEADARYLSVMFRLSEDIPQKELKELGKVFRRMMVLDADGR